MTSGAHPDWHVFPTPEVLAETLAGKVAALLADAIARRGQAFLALSGGTTPRLLLAALSDKDLDWSRVIVTLVDERFVPEDSSRSNAALLRDILLTGKAAAARFVPLYHAAVDVETAARLADATLSSLPWPLDVAVLGMGKDGHTASFFPDATDQSAVNPDNPATVVAAHAPSAGEPRLTLTLPRIAEADFIALHIEGPGKRTVLQQALAGEAKLPIRLAFDHARSPVQVYWAP